MVWWCWWHKTGKKRISEATKMVIFKDVEGWEKLYFKGIQRRSSRSNVYTKQWLGKKKKTVQFALMIILGILPQTALIVHTLKNSARFNITCRRTYSNWVNLHHFHPDSHHHHHISTELGYSVCFCSEILQLYISEAILLQD